MSGLNWHYMDKSAALSRKQAGIKCVFISHQKKDSDACSKIADYLIEAGINVYFDEYDRDLRISRQSNDAKGVTNSIRKAINVSSHMLCVVSPNTLSSTWVPFEVGYGFDKTELGVLTLKGISKSSLPDYIKTAKFIVRDIWDVNTLVSNFLGIDRERLTENRTIKTYSETYHPLSNYMDGINTN